jgi:outer membrane protein assembly factor BamA
MFWRYLAAVFCCLTVHQSAHADSLLPSRERMDTWLNQLGADGKFDASKGIDWGVMPGPFYTPELGLGVGAAVVGMYRPDASGPDTQNSTLSLSGYVSSTGALGLSMKNYAFFADDRWRIFLDGALDNTPTYYWGRGFRAGARDSHKQKYTSQAFSIRPDLYRRIAPNTWMGIGWSFSTLHAGQIEDAHTGPLLKEPDGASVTSSGFSVSLNYDSRDFVPNPRKGQTLFMRYTHYAPNLGSNTRFNEYESRYSLYHALDQSDILAWEVNGHFTQGDVPWNMLPLLGSSHRMRGYYEGRYRDRNAISSQLELRHKLSWRHGIVGWLGGGTMSPRFSQLGKSRWLPSAGVGYRFEFKPRMNVRLDFGVGKGSSGFYFQAGEAF